MKSWLQDKEIRIYLTKNEGKSILAWINYSNFKDKIYDCSTENAYIDILDSNMYHITIKMKPIDVKSSRYNDFNTEHNDTYPKFKSDGHVRMSK